MKKDEPLHHLERATLQRQRARGPALQVFLAVGLGERREPDGTTREREVEDGRLDRVEELIELGDERGATESSDFGTKHAIDAESARARKIANRGNEGVAQGRECAVAI